MAPQIALACLKRLRVASWLFVFAVPIYWAATGSGLYRVFADMQIAVFDDHMGLVSWAIPFLILAVPSIYLSGRIDALATRGFSAEQKNAYFKKVYIGDIEESARYRRRLLRNTPLILSITAMVCGLTAGLYFVAQAYLVGPLTAIDVNALHAGTKPPSRYLDVNGFAYTRGTIAVQTTIQDATFDYFYIPFVAEPLAATDKPIEVLIKVKAKWRYDEIRQMANGPQRVNIKGVLTHDMHGAALDGFRRKGPVIAEHAWILEDLESPGEYRNLGVALIVVLGGLGGLGVGCTLWFRRRAMPSI